MLVEDRLYKKLKARPELHNSIRETAMVVIIFTKVQNRPHNIQLPYKSKYSNSESQTLNPSTLNPDKRSIRTNTLSP